MLSLQHTHLICRLHNTTCIFFSVGPATPTHRSGLTWHLSAAAAQLGGPTSAQATQFKFQTLIGRLRHAPCTRCASSQQSAAHCFVAGCAAVSAESPMIVSGGGLTL